jgi:hypothetical protein
MREHRTKDGKLIRFMSRSELEGLRGYKPYAGGRRGRAACPFHDGQSTTSLSIDWEIGWASCWGCGKDAFSIRVEDHPDTRSPNDENSSKSSVRRSTAPPRAERPKHDLRDVQERLGVMLDTWTTTLPGSPGATYLGRRGIPLDVAQRLGIGWATAGPLNRRAVFPLSGPDGRPTSATGRAIDDHTTPKYKALSSGDGYIKTLFNGGAIAQAKASGHPLVIVEGPIDAAACVTGGLPLTVAIGSTAYAHPEHFAGVSLALLVLDADDAGQEARRNFAAALMVVGVEVLSLPAAAFDGCKDLGEFWQTRRALPLSLVARATGPHRANELSIVTTPKDDDVEAPLDEFKRQDQWRLEPSQELQRLIFADLPDDLQAEAEVLTAELIAGGFEAIGQFRADLECNGPDLMAEDYTAAWYALETAIAALLDPDRHDINAA